MTVQPALKIAAAVGTSVLTIGLLAGCSSSRTSKKTAAEQQASALINSLSALASSAANAATSAPSDSDTASDSSSDSASDSTTASAVAASGGGAKCTDLTNAAATSALGKPTTVTLSQTPITLPGLSICDVKVGSEVYPIQLDVNINNGPQLFAADKDAFSGTDLAGIGDKAFTSSVGVEVLKGSVEIKVNGPAGAVLSGDFSLATAVAKAMLGTLK